MRSRILLGVLSAAVVIVVASVIFLLAPPMLTKVSSG